MGENIQYFVTEKQPQTNTKEKAKTADFEKSIVNMTARYNHYKELKHPLQRPN